MFTIFDLLFLYYVNVFSNLVEITGALGALRIVNNAHSLIEMKMRRRTTEASVLYAGGRHGHSDGCFVQTDFESFTVPDDYFINEG